MAQVHVGLDLEHETGERPRSRVDRPAIALARRRGWRGREEALEEHVHPVVGERASEVDGRGFTGRDPLEVHRRPRDLDQLDLFLEPCQALGSQRLLELRIVEGDRARFWTGLSVVVGLGVHDDLLVLAVVHTDEAPRDTHRPGGHEAADPEFGFDVVEQPERVFADPVALVHEREDRQTPPLANTEQLFGLGLDALAVVEQHDRAIGGGERPVSVFREVLVPGRVEQVDAETPVVEVQYARGDGDPAFLFHLEPVRGGVARSLSALHRPSRMDGASVEE